MPGNGTFNERARALRFRLFRRVHRRGRRALWAFNRDSVARGVAVGLFFGVLLPVAQIVAAIFAAVVVRANLLVTAASTFVTNPVTLPFVYYYAFRIGSLLTERDREVAADVTVSEEAAEQALEVAAWHVTLIDWASSIALPFLVGLLFLALTAAVLGYALIHAAWGISRVLGGPGRARSRAS